MNKHVRAVVLAAVLLASPLGRLWAQQHQTTTTTPTRRETELLTTIVFITVELKEPEPHQPGTSNRSTRPRKPAHLYGTGFLVSVPDSRLTGRAFTYIVTNRHVAEAIEENQKGDCTRLPIQKMYVTMNLKEPVNGKRSDLVDITTSPQMHWYFPDDAASDLAVMPFGIDPKYDARVIGLDQFLTTEILDKQHVVPGDRVLTGGFFYGYAGLHGIQPILRQGVLAMLPDGPMTTTTCKSGEVYLADVHIIPGNSGSPIFIVPALSMGANVTLGGVPNTFGLLGVVSGYMQETEELTLKASTIWKGSVHANSGIAVVVPAQQLRDLLQSSAIQRLRDEAVEQHLSH
jgi:hypothetical protein